VTGIPDHAQLAADLVTCTRLLVMEGVLEASGHVSARLPGTDLVLIQDRETSRAAVTTDDLLVVDLDGAVVAGSGRPPAETAIHTGVYRARPDVMAVCHGHPETSVIFSVIDTPLVPVRHFAFEYPGGVPVHPDSRHIRTREQGDALAATLGDAPACLLRSHGSVVVAGDLKELLMDTLDLELNARTLLAALAAGTVHPIDAAEAAELRASYAKNGFRATKTWDHFVALGRHAGVLAPQTTITKE
jgi:ribulose-5-phosphate 4-epimerase/fuculose-1-phosphate aldolase